MAVYIERLNIDHFRGIHGLALEDLNHVNIIAGDNNSGKTSVLEALLFMRNPKDFNNTLRIARSRDMGTPFNSASTYENFMNLFPKNIESTEISIHGICMGDNVMFRLVGEQKTIMLSPDDLFQNLNFETKRSRLRNYSGGLETNAFMGELQYAVGNYRDGSPIEFHAHSKTTGREIERDNYLNIVYLSPIDHLRGNVFSKILRNDAYKEICLSVLRLFDPQILDLLYLKNEDAYRPIPVEYIKHETLGNMPISTYGDGIKKVLSLANGIAQAANGVLMIDELETSIHSKYYDDIFRFIMKACKQFQVQVFVTTHSMEAIDGLLSTQDYDVQDSDDISVITFKKESDNSRTYSRILSGRRVYTNREEFGFEVRL